MTPPTIIIGGGLSGLYAARLLHAREESFLVLEARSEWGGRIRTELRGGCPFDLGPSWFWPDLNPRMARLVRELNLSHHGQNTRGDALIEEPGGTIRRQAHREIDPRNARRLAGGSHTLIEALLPALPADCLLPGHRVTSLERHDAHVSITATTTNGERSFTATRVIIALPPRLLAHTITITPSLPSPLTASLRNTPTWMAGDAKFFATYNRPFWRENDLSGTAYCESGPLSESHDASLPGGPGALLGFLIPAPAERSALGEALVPLCLEQLARLFGPAAATPLDVLFMDWAKESFTATPLDLPLVEHPAYGLPECTRGLWDDRLRLAGTESAPEHGGHLEGALEAAEAATRNPAC
ncbi:MAG: NAD(P)-binding protein [Akkermansiaceae bacterium]|nr:NAD(P)-binding protein [Akkermansiaceae bacterium]